MIKAYSSIILFVSLCGLMGCNASRDDYTLSSHACESLISSVDIIPFHKSVDSNIIFNKIIERGSEENIVNCLINQIDNTTEIDDIRESRLLDKIYLGDVAIFLLVQIFNVSLTDFLPDDYDEKWELDGIFAYHEYIATNNARADVRMFFIRKQDMRNKLEAEH